MPKIAVDGNLPARRRHRPKDTANAERHLEQSVSSLRQFKELQTLAKGGGKVAGWSLLGGAAGMGVALGFHIADVAVAGTVGSMIGVGAYALRWLQRFKTSKYEELDDEPRDVNALKLAGTLSHEEYTQGRKKIMRRFGITQM